MTSLVHIKNYSRGLVWVLALLMVVVQTAPVLAVESGGVGGRPANPDPSNPRTESIFLFNLDDGQEATNAVKLYNNSDSKKTINVYAVDSQVSSGGAFACAQKAEEKRSVGAWTTLDKTSVTLSPNQTEVVAFKLRVPKNTAAGEHNGCIVMQEADQTPQAAGNGITLSFRSAIRMAVTVKGEIRKELAFTRLETSKNDKGKRIVNVALKNSGNVSLDTSIDVRIKTLFGSSMQKIGGDFPVLAGGESEFNLEANEPFWGGMYLLSAKALYNSDPTVGIGKGEKSAHVSKNGMLLVAPKPVAAVIEIVAVALLVIAATTWIRRKKTHKHWHTNGDTYKVKKSENIQKIAEDHGVSWKTLARVNGLRAPYQVETGQELKLASNKKASNKKTEEKPKTEKTAKNKTKN